MFRLDKRTIFLMLLLGGVAAGLAYVLYASGLIDVFINKDQLLSFIHRYQRFAIVVFIGLQALQVMVAPIPGEVTGFAGGLLFGPVWGVLYSTIGLTIGSWLAFMLARLLGRPLVEKLVSSEVLRRYDYVMRHKGLFLAFLLFLVPGFPKDYLCYVFGLGHMRQRDFLLVSIPGRLLGTVLLAMGGAYFREQRYGALFVLAGIGLLMVLIAMIYRRKIERLIRRMQAARRLKAMLAHRKERKRIDNH